MRRVLRVLAALVVLSTAGLLGVAALVIAAEPAAADNCKELVNEFSDLLDEANVQDCLRTGGPWGAVLGTVVAATAVGVGVAGLSGRKPPGESPPPAPPPDDDPCTEALNMKEHTLALLARREERQQEIVIEWQRWAADAAKFAEMYRTLKEQEYRLGLMRVYATVGNTAGCGLVVVGIIGAMGSISALATARLAAITASAAGRSTMGVLLDKAMVHLAANASRAVAVGSPWFDPVRSFSTDLTAAEITKPLWAKLAAVASSYLAAAHQFNAAAREWANDAQQSLADIDREIQDARSRFRTAFTLCDNQAPDERDEGEYEPSGNIMVPQAQTHFGDVWWFGGFRGAVG